MGTSALSTLPSEWALREAFREWFAFMVQEVVGQRLEAKDLRRCYGDILLGYRALGVEAGDRVYHRSAAAWRRETGRCPGCGQPVALCEGSG